MVLIFDSLRQLLNFISDSWIEICLLISIVLLIIFLYLLIDVIKDIKKAKKIINLSASAENEEYMLRKLQQDLHPSNSDSNYHSPLDD